MILSNQEGGTRIITVFDRHYGVLREFAIDGNNLTPIAVESRPLGYEQLPETFPEGLTHITNNTIYVTRLLDHDYVCYITCKQGIERSILRRDLFPHIRMINDQPVPKLALDTSAMLKLGDKLTMIPSISGW